MKLTIPELIRRLEVAAVRAQDLNMQVEIDGLYYLHASSFGPHRLELVDQQARDEQRRTIQRLERENELLQSELSSYKQAYG